MKILWDVMTQCDREIEAIEEIVLVAKKTDRGCIIIDNSVPGDNCISEKNKSKSISKDN